ncbi:MAG: hypothetical protein AAFO07_17585 [Bacteroidota bacterium]
MPDNSNTPFDKEFENLAWEKMNALLDRELPVRKRRVLPVWFWWVGAVMVLISLAGFWYNSYYKSITKNDKNKIIAHQNESINKPYVTIINCIDDLLPVEGQSPITSQDRKITRSQDEITSQDRKITRSKDEIVSQDQKITGSQDEIASQDHRITGSQDETARSQDRKTTRSQDETARSQDHKITGSQDEIASQDETSFSSSTFIPKVSILNSEITLLDNVRSDSSLFVTEPFTKKQSRFFVNTGVLVDKTFNGYSIGAGLEYDLSSKWTIGFALQHDRYNLSFEALTDNVNVVSPERDSLGITTNTGTAVQVILPKQELAVNTFGLQMLSAYKVSNRFALNTGIGLDYRFVRQRAGGMDEFSQSDPNGFNNDLEFNNLDSNTGINEFVNHFDLRVSVGTSYILSARWSLEASYRRGFSSLFRQLDYPHKRSQLFLGMKYSF